MLHVFFGKHCDRCSWIKSRIPEDYPHRICWHEIERPDPTTFAMVDFYGIEERIADKLPVLVSDAGNGDSPSITNEINVIANVLGIRDFFVET